MGPWYSANSSILSHCLYQFTHAHIQYRYTTRRDLAKGSQERLGVNVADPGSAADVHVTHTGLLRNTIHRYATGSFCVIDHFKYQRYYICYQFERYFLKEQFYDSNSWSFVKILNQFTCFPWIKSFIRTLCYVYCKKTLPFAATSISWFLSSHFKIMFQHITPWNWAFQTLHVCNLLIKCGRKVKCV